MNFAAPAQGGSGWRSLGDDAVEQHAEAGARQPGSADPFVVWPWWSLGIVRALPVAKDPVTCGRAVGVGERLEFALARAPGDGQRHREQLADDPVQVDHQVLPLEELLRVGVPAGKGGSGRGKPRGLVSDEEQVLAVSLAGRRRDRGGQRRERRLRANSRCQCRQSFATATEGAAMMSIRPKALIALSWSDIRHSSWATL